MRHILLMESDDHTYIASVPSLSNVRANGQTADEALSNVKLAVEHRLNSADAPNSDNEPINLEYVAAFSEALSDEQYCVFVTQRRAITPAAEAWALDKLQQMIDAGELPTSALRSPHKPVGK